MKDDAASLHFNAACGFVHLQDWERAYAELENLPPDQRTIPAVLVLKAGIFIGLQRWDALECVSRTLLNEWPEDPQWKATWIVAIRRTLGSARADAILEHSISSAGNDAAYLYETGRHAAHLLDRQTSWPLLQRAFTLDPDLRIKALDDPVIESIWDSPSE